MKIEQLAYKQNYTDILKKWPIDADDALKPTKPALAEYRDNLELEGKACDADTIKWALETFDALIGDVVLVKDPKTKIELFNINNFYRERMEARKLSNKTWPENLSTKEKVICKLNMIRNLIKVTLQKPAHEEQFISYNAEIQLLSEYLLYVIDDEIYSILKTKNFYVEGATEAKKWPGLPKRKADFYSQLYKKIHSNCFGNYK